MWRYISVFSVLFHLSVYYSYASTTMSWLLKFWNQRMWILQLYSPFFKTVLDILGPFHFHVNFRISFISAEVHFEFWEELHRIQSSTGEYWHLSSIKSSALWTCNVFPLICFSVTKSCLTLCNPMDYIAHVRLPCLPLYSRVCSNSCLWVSDAIQPSHPLLPPSPFAFSLFHWGRVFSNELAYVF